MIWASDSQKIFKIGDLARVILSERVNYIWRGKIVRIIETYDSSSTNAKYVKIDAGRKYPNLPIHNCPIDVLIKICGNKNENI